MTEGYVWSDAQIGKWLRHVVNVKQLQERSRGMVVRVMSTSRQAAFCYVQSGSDESVWYSVRVWNDARGLLHTRCSCPWGQHRPKESPECACSHVMAAMEALAGLVGRSLSFWLDMADAERQHRPIVEPRAEVVATSRKVGAADRSMFHSAEARRGKRRL
ncbi:MAG: SWIM zinc finger family protein [bacterium]